MEQQVNKMAFSYLQLVVVALRDAAAVEGACFVSGQEVLPAVQAAEEVPHQAPHRAQQLSGAHRPGVLRTICCHCNQTSTTKQQE